MANNYTHFSCTLDVGSANLERAIAIYAEHSERLAINHDAIGFVVECDQPDSPDAKALRMHEEESGNVNHVIDFVVACAKEFRLTGRWGMEWSETCSKPRIGEFGGGAVVVDLSRRRIAASISTNTWLQQMVEGRHRRHPVPRGPSPAAA